jgi:hypothetical protein
MSKPVNLESLPHPALPDLLQDNAKDDTSPRITDDQPQVRSTDKKVCVTELIVITISERSLHNVGLKKQRLGK